MATIPTLDGKKVLAFKDGTPVDDSLFENEPLENTFDEVAAIPEAEIEKLIKDLESK